MQQIHMERARERMNSSGWSLELFVFPKRKGGEEDVGSEYLICISIFLPIIELSIYM